MILYKLLTNIMDYLSQKYQKTKEILDFKFGLNFLLKSGKISKRTRVIKYLKDDLKFLTDPNELID